MPEIPTRRPSKKKHVLLRLNLPVSSRQGFSKKSIHRELTMILVCTAVLKQKLKINKSFKIKIFQICQIFTMKFGKGHLYFRYFELLLKRIFVGIYITLLSGQVWQFSQLNKQRAWKTPTPKLKRFELSNFV